MSLQVQHRRQPILPVTSQQRPSKCPNILLPSPLIDVCWLSGRHFAPAMQANSSLPSMASGVSSMALYQPKNKIDGYASSTPSIHVHAPHLIIICLCSHFCTTITLTTTKVDIPWSPLPYTVICAVNVIPICQCYEIGHISRSQGRQRKLNYVRSTAETLSEHDLAIEHELTSPWKGNNEPSQAKVEPRVAFDLIWYT
jgi:hypothetical protein